MDWAQVLVVILSLFLAIFLLLAIVLTVMLIKVTRQIKTVTGGRRSRKNRFAGIVAANDKQVF
jgi:hypothetical protein